MQAHDILPAGASTAQFNGMEVRKGTIAAFLANARCWLNPDSTTAERAQAETDMAQALPAMAAIGVFDVLLPRDPHLAAWLAAKQQPCACTK
ncbi:hypothetical protein GCM10027277_20690 [Pseudoduganella ginsengisoli]|uniref:Preprotein translocase subunit SecD n=1 Tax=Pseudoduganella ginsengisoli TaxID=1462440 RepID=A0A6L6PTY0_9BURK|nr:hypothetical protein [Pseudoduganella ginsengisoli]MTW00676.1 hypothetical protein [Pseudoduganella ginsengisoli]